MKKRYNILKCALDGDEFVRRTADFYNGISSHIQGVNASQ